MPVDHPTLEAALQYAARGWKIFPARIKPKKMSYVAGLRSGGPKWGMTDDTTTIRGYWDRWPRARIGLPTGLDNGFIVVDADTVSGHGVDGVGNWLRLCQSEGGLPATLTAMSPSGSMHYYFLHPVTMRVRSSAGELAPGVDVRGDGGMVIAPPSVGKERGERYQWVDSTQPIAKAPRWLLERVCEATREEAGSFPSNDRPVDLDEVAAAVDAIPNDSSEWSFWNRVGMAIYAATGGSDQGFQLFDRWSRKWEGYSEGDTRRKWHQELSRSPPNRISAASLFYLADSASRDWRGRHAAREATSAGGRDSGTSGVSLSDFRAYSPGNQFIYVPSKEMWPAEAVNARLGKIPVVDADGEPVLDENDKPKKVPAAVWLHQHRPVEMMTWAPGMPLIIQDRLIFDGGWIERKRVSTFNLYQPPRKQDGDPTRAGPWIDHVRRIYPADADHIIRCFAHRVQRPQEKINHALVLIGRQGIGKDTMLEPLKQAVGVSNFQEVGPHDILSQFNAFLRAVVLRVSEARDLGDVNRYQLYERMKVICASPPDVLRVNEKFLRAHYVLNCCFVVITTNRPDSLHIEADDRRHYVAESEATREELSEEYWQGLWKYLLFDGGCGHVAQYLQTLDISDFNPKAPPKHTDAFWRIVESAWSAESGTILEVLMRMGNPDALVKDDLLTAARDVPGELYDWLSTSKNGRALNAILEDSGYITCRNPHDARGKWLVDGTQRIVYVKSSLSHEDRQKAAKNRQNRGFRVIDGGRSG